MDDIVAFIVGIERYDHDPERFNIPGPGANAVAIAKLLLGKEVESSNIHLFLETEDQLLLKSAQGLKVNLRTSATFDKLDCFWRESLVDEQDCSKLLFFWSGHGYSDLDGSQLLLCSDFKFPQFKQRVIDISNVLRHFRSHRYRYFSEQLCLVDACANHANISFDANKTPPERIAQGIKQSALFASREGEYAKGGEHLGAFTQIALHVLEQVDLWPDLDHFSTQIQKECEAHTQLPFRYRFLSEGQEFENTTSSHSPPSLSDSKWSLLASESMRQFDSFQKSLDDISLPLQDWKILYPELFGYVQGGSSLIVLLGRAGMGKSYTLWQLATELNRDGKDFIWIHAASLGVQLISDLTNNLREKGGLDTLGLDPSLTILIDEWDAIPASTEAQKRLLADLEYFVQNYQWRLIITSRKNAWLQVRQQATQASWVEVLLGDWPTELVSRLIQVSHRPKATPNSVPDKESHISHS